MTAFWITLIVVAGIGAWAIYTKWSFNRFIDKDDAEERDFAARMAKNAEKQATYLQMLAAAKEAKQESSKPHGDIPEKALSEISVKIIGTPYISGHDIYSGIEEQIRSGRRLTMTHAGGEAYWVLREPEDEDPRPAPKSKRKQATERALRMRAASNKL